MAEDGDFIRRRRQCGACEKRFTTYERADVSYPVVVKKVVGVPPLLVILALLVGIKLVGFLGVLLSVPIAGAIQELVNDIEKRKARLLVKSGLAPGAEGQ